MWDVLGTLLGRLAEFLRKREGRAMSPLRQFVREEQAKGRALLREIKLADDSDRTRRRLTERVVKWSSDYQLRLNEEDPTLFERFRTPGLPDPITMKVLRRAVRQDLAALKAIKRHLAWPVWLLKLPRPLRRSWHFVRGKGWR